MKLILNIILGLLLSQSYAQQQFDLTAKLYSNTHLSEAGEYLEECFLGSVQTINTIHIKVPKSYLCIDSIGLTLNEIVITYIVWNVDTVIVKSQTEISRIKKGELQIFAPQERPFLFFQGLDYMDIERGREILFCDKTSRYSIDLKQVSGNLLAYNLYFLNSCNALVENKTILHSGFIKLKKGKKYKPKYIHK
jgi:hypothetical protein